MTQGQILEEIGRLPISDRLTLIEDVLRAVRQDLRHVKQAQRQTNQRRQVATAAKALLADYTEGGELTAFTALDGEDFHETR
jgi:50S ribosomal subunit-associated GTPase HflX